MAKFNKSKHKNYIDRKGRLHKKSSSVNISPKFFNRDFTLLNNIPAPGEGFPPGITNWIQYYEWLQTSSEGNYYLEQIDILLDQGYSCNQIGFSRHISGDINSDGLLNVLDGIAGKPGLITFITTNYRTRLDSAFLRPGRIDYNILFEYLY